MEKNIDKSEIRNRLELLCLDLKCSAREFSSKIGKSSSYIANLKKDMTTDVLLNIHIMYPQVNIMWLVTGKGERIVNESSNYINNDSLIFHLKEENRLLKEENNKLIKENARLQAKLEILGSEKAG